MHILEPYLFYRKWQFDMKADNCYALISVYACSHLRSRLEPCLQQVNSPPSRHTHTHTHTYIALTSCSSPPHCSLMTSCWTKSHTHQCKQLWEKITVSEKSVKRRQRTLHVLSCKTCLWLHHSEKLWQEKYSEENDGIAYHTINIMSW